MRAGKDAALSLHAASRFGQLCATALCLAVALGAAGSVHAAAKAAATSGSPRIAVISAYEPEMTLLLPKVEGRKDTTINGTVFTTGRLEGKNVVLFLSGVSMVNAAMNTQLVLDRFKVSHIVFSGIAGGVNPALHVGDVTVAARWGQYLESLFAREVSPGKYQAPGWMTMTPYANFGMVHPQNVGVRSVNDKSSVAVTAGSGGAPRKFWFDVDAGMLAAAQTALAGAELAKCAAPKGSAPAACLGHTPKIVFGGNGVSGSAFIDNAAFRDYTFKTFGANVLDMETAATAQVAHANGVPFIAFRSLSDLAGGGDGENEIGTFFQIAADNSAKVVKAFLKAWKP